MQSTVHITVQTGLAVGDTQEEKEKAEFTKLQVWVSIHMTSKIKLKCSLQFSSTTDREA